MASRPSMPDGITRLLVRDSDAKIGKLLWSRLSAVSHVTYFGLQSAMLFGDVTPSLSPGVKIVPVGTNSSSVFLVAFCVVRALREAATARFALMGWEDDAWTAAHKRAAQIENALFPSRLAERPATTDERAGPQGSGESRPG
jgi:hypothetical protein